MRQVFTLFFSVLTLCGQAQSDGSLDITWGTMGKVVNTPSTGSGSGTPVPVDQTNRQKMLVLSDRKILLSFTGGLNPNSNFGIARFNEDGSFDAGFGGGTGFATVDFGGDDYATAVAIQSDGKIIVSGYSIDGSGVSRFAVARFTSSGVLDNTFGNAGTTLTLINLDAAAYALAIRPNDKIVLGGYSSTAPGSFSFALAQYTANGVLDAGNFNGATGFVVTTINGFDQVNDLAIQTDGKVVAGGYTVVGSADRDFALARYNANGTLDNAANSFGANGIVVTALNATQDDEIYDLAYHATSGKIVAAGGAYNGSDYDFAFGIYLANGTGDPIYGSGTGRIISSLGKSEIAYTVLIQGDNKILLGGTANSGFASTDADFVSARYVPGGGLDASYGTGGISVVDFGGDDRNYSMAFGISYIMLGGITDVTGSSLALARLTNIGAPLPVQLSPLTLSRQGAGAQLSWTTFNEQELSRFEVQRSPDGRVFTAIGSVTAAGYSVTTRGYSFTDAQPGGLVNFYRLRYVNNNGTFGFSNIVALRLGGKDLQAFPNPVRTALQVQFTQPAGAVRLQIADVSGRVLRNLQFRSTGATLSTSIDMSGMRSGVYFIRVNEDTITVVKE